MTQLSPDRAAASMASTSSPVGVRLTETSMAALGMPADTKAARSASRSGLGLVATNDFNVDSKAAVVAATAGSTLAGCCAVGDAEAAASWPAGGAGVASVASVAGVAVQADIVMAAAIASDNPATRAFGTVADSAVSCFGVVPLLIT